MVELVTVDIDYSYEGEKRFYAISLSRDSWLVVIHVAPEDVARFKEITSTSWEAGPLGIGQSSGVEVFWSVNADDKDTIIISVGHDDESDISFAVPAVTITEILDAIVALDQP